MSDDLPLSPAPSGTAAGEPSHPHPHPHPRADLPPAARRALAEAEARRARRESEKVHPGDLAREVNGRKGAEPVRYGDWEKNGIISDF